MADTPARRRESTSVSSASLSISARTTFIPDCASSRAVARPMPLPAPVITATFPSSSFTNPSLRVKLLHSDLGPDWPPGGWQRGAADTLGSAGAGHRHRDLVDAARPGAG